MKRLLAIFLTVVLILGLSTVLLPAQIAVANPGNVVYVDDDNTGYEDGSEADPFNTIQEGINAALSGDTVQVAPGTYNENIVMKSQVIILGSGAYATTINGTGAGSVVVATDVELAELDGFTITNGIAEGGGGIEVHWYSSPTISNCIITGNSAPYGGGIWINDYSSPAIKNCIIAGNEATDTEFGYGGGIFSTAFSTPTVVNCTITGNSAVWGGGIANIATFLIPVTNSIIWGNTADSEPSIYNFIVREDPIFSYCDIEGCGGSGEGWVSSLGTDGGNNIDDDPLFVDPAGGDYHLQAESPCIDTGTSTNAPSIDLDGVSRPQPEDGQVDMGAYERPAGSNLVDIDIKPGSDPNSINPSGKGVIPVAILTTDNFDATTVDPDTVIFGPGGAEPVHTAIEDVDDDGDTDMILHFRTQDTGIELGDTEATLTSQTTDGIEITGTDSVRIVPPEGKGKANKGSNLGEGGGQDNGNGNPNPGQGNNQDGGNDNPNSGQGNNQGGNNGNSNPGKGKGKGK